MLIHLWQQGLLAQAFLVITPFSTCLLAAVFLRLAAQNLSADVFVIQINKLLAAGNYDRAVKLANAGERRPVAQMLQIGLASWQASTSGAREEMSRRLPEVLADAFRGLLPAQIAGAAAIGLGALLLADGKDTVDRPLIAVPLGVVGLLVLMATVTAQRLRVDATRVVDKLGS